MRPDQCQSQTFWMTFSILRLRALLSECVNSISINQCSACTAKWKQEGISFLFFPFAFTRRTKEKAPTCVKRCVFLFLFPNKSEFCTAEMSSLIRRCNGWTKAYFSETRASGLMSFLTVWVQHWSICSLASCGRGRGALPTSMPALQLQRYPIHMGLDFLPRWCQYHRAISTAVRSSIS